LPTLSIDATLPPISLLDRLGPDADRPEISPQCAVNYVRALATTHYENFSVLSRLVPPELRDDFAAVYAFCRWADDLGDETGKTDEARARSLELLAWWRRELLACFDFAAPAPHTPDGPPPPPAPVFIALLPVIRRHKLTVEPFADLIDAFEQDQRIRAYQTWDQVIDYCRRSANPVGRIVLALAGYPDTPENAERYRMSDATCTALQLTNHWQDVRRDLLERDRVYIPTADTGVTPEMLRDWAARPEDPTARIPYIRMLRSLIVRTWDLFHQGRPLPRLLHPRIRPVVWLFGAGGESVLRAVERSGCTTLWKRPTLARSTKAWLVFRAWMSFRLADRGGTSDSIAVRGETGWGD
jgi:squalene synthase HpnC